MKKRDFLQAVLATSSVAFVSSRLLKAPSQGYQANLPVVNDAVSGLNNNTIDSSSQSQSPPLPSMQNDVIPPPTPEELELVSTESLEVIDSDLMPGSIHTEREIDVADIEDGDIDTYLDKIRNFDADFANDVYLSEANSLLIEPVLKRLERIQSYVGHGNYNLLSFDDMLFYARNYTEIGDFTDPELNFLDEIFHTDASSYGFFGQKVTAEISNRMPLNDVQKISNNGHYLLKGESLNHFQHIQNDVGDRLLLTSGLRNIVKQMHLFLVKTQQSENNLSKASRSLAPPGHSFHGIGDFDVGKIGLGKLNFTANFSRTEEFKRMINLGYIDIRYTNRNLFGVRYEPWHIKIS